MKLGVVVLAAGLGTRMRSATPKVLHRIAGRPLVGWVLAALEGVDPVHTVVVVGHGADDVTAVLPDGVATAVQERQLGTGHAASVGLNALDAACDTVLLLCGDTPLLRAELITELVGMHAGSGRAVTMVSADLDDAGAYGRVLRDGAGEVTGVVEAQDATPGQLAITEINAGIFVFDRAALAAALGQVGSKNAQGEMYLPDTLPLVGGPIGALRSADPDVVAGVNTRVDLAACEAAIQARLREELMLAGVTMPDPSGVYVDHDVTVGQDTVLLPGVHLRSGTTVGEGCTIGPDCVLEGCAVGDGASVTAAHAFSSEIGPAAQVGPFAYLRPGTRLAESGKIGTFVETKNARIGRKAKVPHLSYMGDVEIGEGSNIGAGNITANYDGFRKHATRIGARVKTGSDCVFVAPVTLGDDVMTGAGSIITDDVPDGALGIARARQAVIEGFTAKAVAKAKAANDSGGH
ncbi:MAG: bifunctional UDP-N-acetylglucosamine diphosphorylase/glucosamine-1-phosphate N-acetyltransferase GlmU [Thermoleophilia bacterium]|nr:bifunctional UDP-N-acetylglucosamine diphosphorylase/glucosamine-1-phosphate N-acetyltransferase GlmU [Thermoleophilia bacterium]